MMSSACVSLRPQQLKPQTHGAAIGHHTQLTATSATTVTMSPKPHKNQSGSVHQKTKNPRTVPGVRGGSIWRTCPCFPKPRTASSLQDLPDCSASLS